MPSTPRMVTNTNVSADVINAIRNSASQNYQDYVPYITPDSDSLRGIGNIIMDNPALLNEFTSALVNRIAFVIFESKTYTNPLGFLKKGMIDNGETIEDIFVAMAEPYQYNPDAGASEIYGKYMPDVRSAFYVMNKQIYYPITVNDAQLKTAFLSFDSMNNFIENVIAQCYTAWEYDEQNIMLYLLAIQILNNKTYIVNTDGVDDKDKADTTLVHVRALASEFLFMNDKYNIAGVPTHTNPQDTIILLNPWARANIDVRALAAAFNISYADFLNQTVTIPSFASINQKRLAQIFANDDNFHELTDEEISALAEGIDVFVIDRNYIQCYDNLMRMRDSQNPVSLNRNYFLHHWGTYCVSPFANHVAFGQYNAINPTSLSAKGLSVELDNPSNDKHDGTLEENIKVNTKKSK